MSLIFKNPTIKTDYELSQKIKGLSFEETSKQFAKHKLTEERIAFSILVNYLSSFYEIGEECEELYEPNSNIDLTYNTLKNFPVLIARQYFHYVVSGSYTQEQALEIANKTIASYFMLLCMNEHMCFPTVAKLQDFDDIIKNPSAIPSDSWMGFTCKVGVNKEYDLLQELGQVARITASGSFRVRVSRLVDLYKQMCGVDLRDHGLDNFEIAVQK